MSLKEIIKKSGKQPGKPWPSYAWFGGYDMFYICDDGETLCADCMNDKTNPIHFYGDNDGWKIIDVDAICNTDSLVQCAHCNKVLQEEWEGNES